MRINKYYAGLLGLLLLLVPSLVFSQAKVGTTGVNFLELGVSARAMGMAEAFTANVTDASAVYYNPAGLTYVYGREVMFTHIAKQAGINYEFFGLAYPVDALSGVIGVGVYALSAGDILRTDYYYPFGLDALGNEQYFTANDLAIGLSYSRFLTDKFSFGVTVKFIQENLELYQARSWSADVGTLYNSGFRNFKIGMMISNFGPDMKFIQEEFPLPINFKFGASIDVVDMENNLLTFAMDGSHPSDNLEKYNIGLEYWFQDRFSLRVGHRFNYDSDGITAGGGLILPIAGEMDLSVDYAYQNQNFGFSTDVHRFSIGLVF